MHTSRNHFPLYLDRSSHDRFDLPEESTRRQRNFEIGIGHVSFSRVGHPAEWNHADPIRPFETPVVSGKLENAWRSQVASMRTTASSCSLGWEPDRSC